MKRFFLVRHAQSLSNVDNKTLQHETNVGIKLSVLGHEQVLETSDFLRQHIQSNRLSKIKVWNSPYERTRITAQAIKDSFNTHKLEHKQEESIYLAERQFGLLDDAKNYYTEHRNEVSHYNLHKNQNHDYFARPPLGESPFDMCLRLDFFIKTILAQDTSDTHIIVSHGAAIKGMIMMFQKWTYEQYTEMLNPYNASIHLITEQVAFARVHCKYEGEVFKPSEGKLSQ